MAGPSTSMSQQVIVDEPYVSSITYVETAADKNVNKEWESLQKEESFTKFDWDERRKNCEKVASKQMENWYEREKLYEGMKLTYEGLTQRDKASAENYQVMQNLKLEITKLVTRVKKFKGKKKNYKQQELQLREKLKQYKLLIHQIRLWGDNYYELRLMYTTFEARWSYLKGVDKDEYILGICLADNFVEPKELDDPPISHPDVHPAFAYFHQLFDTKSCLVPITDSTKEVVFQKPSNNQPKRKQKNSSGKKSAHKQKYKMLKKQFGKDLKNLEEKLRSRWKSKQECNNERYESNCEFLYQILYGEDIHFNPKGGPKSGNSFGNQTNKLEILERDFRHELEELEIKIQKTWKNASDDTRPPYSSLEEMISELLRENLIETMGYHEYMSKVYQHVGEELHCLCTATNNLKKKAKENRLNIITYNKQYEGLNIEAKEYKKKRRTSPIEKIRELGQLMDMLDDMSHETELMENNVNANEKRIRFLFAVEAVQERRKRKGPITPKKQDPIEPIFNPYMLAAYEDQFKNWGSPYDQVDDNLVEDFNKIIYRTIEKERNVSNNSWYECAALIDKISEIADEQNTVICCIRDCNRIIRDYLVLSDTETQIAKLNMAMKHNLIQPFSGKENALADIYQKLVNDCNDNQREWRRTGGHVTKLFLILESIIQEAKALNSKIAKTERKAKNEQKRKGKEPVVRFQRDEEKYTQNYDILLEKLQCITRAEIQYVQYLDEFKVSLSKAMHDESLLLIKRIIHNEISLTDPAIMAVATNMNQIQQPNLQPEGQQSKTDQLPSSLEKEVSKAIANFNEVVDEKHTEFLHKILDIKSTDNCKNHNICLPPMEIRAPREAVAQPELPENAQPPEETDNEPEAPIIENNEQNVEALDEANEESNNLQPTSAEPEQQVPIEDIPQPDEEQVHDTPTNESMHPVAEEQSSQCSNETPESSKQEDTKETVETPESVLSTLEEDEPIVSETPDSRMYEKYVQIGKKLIENGEEFDRMADRVNQINEKLSRLEEVMVSKLDCLQNTMVNNFTQLANQLQKDVTEQVINAVRTFSNYGSQGAEPILNAPSNEENVKSEEEVNLEDENAKKENNTENNL